jgi:HEAT repeat protein
MTPQKPVNLLTDAQMRQFLVDGYLFVRTELPPEFHQSVFDEMERIIGSEYNPGNNLLPRVPALRHVWNDPNVAGALGGILGGDYYLQPHRYCHLNPPGTPGQKLHRDGFFTRRHTTRHALAFYYPHAVTEELGPTAIVPRSQYFNTRPEDPELLLTAAAGTVAIVEGNMWHRGTPNAGSRKRAMVKFLFARMDEPRAPAWNNASAGWEPDDREGAAPLHRFLWNWHRGTAGNGAAPAAHTGGDRSIPELIAALADESERLGFEAAYELGARGEEAVPALVDTLVNAPDAEQWHPIHERINDGSFPRFVVANASHALTAAGAAAVPALLDALSHPSWAVRASVVETLGDLGLAAAPAVPQLCREIDDPNVYVRRHAAEALGTTSQGSPYGVPALVRALEDGDARVRRSAALALARVGVHAAEAVPALSRALDDDDRYVRGNGAHALRRIGTPEAVETLLEFLNVSRWCPITSRESPY